MYRKRDKLQSINPTIKNVCTAQHIVSLILIVFTMLIITLQCFEQIMCSLNTYDWLLHSHAQDLY